jgi:hypothetical protein
VSLDDRAVFVMFTDVHTHTLPFLLNSLHLR